MEKIVLNGLNIYKFASKFIDANSYVICANKEALVIDPNESKELDKFLTQYSPQKITILLTHEHIDHVIGYPRLQKRYATELICQKNCAEFIVDSRNNYPSLIRIALEYKDEKEGTHLTQEFLEQTEDIFPFCITADKTFGEELSLIWQEQEIFCKHCEGHSPGSCCFILNNVAIFTGDSLIYNTPVITRFPGGNSQKYLSKTKPFLNSMPEFMKVFPGHGRVFEIKEIRNVEF